MSIIIKHPLDALSYRVYVDDIGSADIVTASFTGGGLSYGTATPDNSTTPKSVVVPVSGGTHGGLYQATGTFTLSGGATLVRPITIRLFA